MQRALELLEQTVRNGIDPVISGMGFVPVETRVIKTKNSSTVRVIIFNSRGTGTADCEAVSRQIYPILEMIEELGDFSLEVSSPGIGRELKRLTEYEIFRGQGVSVLVTGDSEWTKGVIDRVDNDMLLLRVKDDTVRIPFHEIKRAKLAFID